VWKCACEGAAALKVLFVEDDDLAADTFGRALRFGRFEVVIVSDADAAVRQIAAEPVDVILIDLRVRPVAIIELVRQLRAREHGRDNTPVAILTGEYYGFRMAVEEELNTLNASLFYKPLLPEHLVMITRALASREM
jgi:DNA-binding response OmpR family regulator